MIIKGNCKLESFEIHVKEKLAAEFLKECLGITMDEPNGLGMGRRFRAVKKPAKVQFNSIKREMLAVDKNQKYKLYVAVL